MYRILILSSAALAFSGCAFNDGMSHFGHGASAIQAPSGGYGYNNCGASHCAPGNSYAVTNINGYQNSQQYGHNLNSFNPIQNYNPAQGYAYGAPQYPSVQAYGSQVNYPAYGGQGYGGIPQLRGAYGRSGQRGYKYGTLGVVNYDLDSEIYGLQGRVGVQTPNYVGGELEGSVGLLRDTQTLTAAELKSGVDYSLGAFARGVVPVGQRLNVFGRAGYHVTKINGSLINAAGRVNVSETTDGFAYGAGAEFAINPRDAIRLDYTRYDLGPGETESVAVSYARKF